MARKHGKQHPPRRRETLRCERDTLWIYGRHPVEAALANDQRHIARLVATNDALKGIERLIRQHRPELEVGVVKRSELDRLVGRNSVHQGLALQVVPLPDLGLAEAVAGANIVAVLDQISDPHNVGAILRSAFVFGVEAIIVQDRHAPGSTGTLAKSASGALEWVPIVQVTNLSRALDELKSLCFWLAGLDGQAEQIMGQFTLQFPTALVLGAEGHGLRRLTREACDSLVAIPAANQTLSLNVSNAAAIAFYEACRLAPAEHQDKAAGG
ncbi:MAG: 23S rRNA (guanosine(2251)-2'-O)-methyltransferase RlmB [Rhodospirillales bacterium]|nr:23S rRNA (guanosine(2251)-2'-O)-methyltransferase RlmB [Rhodospirillales bacterium]